MNKWWLQAASGRRDGSFRDRDEGRTSKALLLGRAAGFGFGLQAAVINTFVGELGHGAFSPFADWSVYVLVVSAIVGVVLLGSAEAPTAAEPASNSRGIPLALRPRDVP